MDFCVAGIDLGLFFYFLRFLRILWQDILWQGIWDVFDNMVFYSMLFVVGKSIKMSLLGFE